MYLIKLLNQITPLIIPLSIYPDPNLGVWQDIYIRQSLGVGIPESYEHLVALNQRFPNLTPIELEAAWNKVKAGDHSLLDDHPNPLHVVTKQ